MPRIHSLVTHTLTALGFVLCLTALTASVACDDKSATQPTATGKAITPAAAPLTGATPAAPAPAAPPPLTAAAKHGQELYERICAVCHGLNGEGYKADQAPALAQADFLASVGDHFLRNAIANGRAKTTMSAWSIDRGGPLSMADVNAMIMYLRSWQKLPRATLDEHTLQGDATRGEAIYTRDCLRCHGAEGVGGPNNHIGDAALLDDVSDGFLRHAIRDGRTGTIMQAFAAPLGDQGVEDLVALLRKWQAVAPPRPVVQPKLPPPLPLGPVPLNPKGPEPIGFVTFPGTTHADVIHKQLERHARMAILDARAPSDYASEHISNAVSVPFYDPSPYLDKLPKNAWLVCYCACPHAESGALAQKLIDAGFKKVTVLDEGLGVWKSKDYGTKVGKDP